MKRARRARRARRAPLFDTDAGRMLAHREREMFPAPVRQLALGLLWAGLLAILAALLVVVTLVQGTL